MFLPLFYHTISNQELPHTKFLYSTKKESEFLADVDFLIANYHPLTFKELAKWPTVPTDSFLLTFDDGLKDLYWVAKVLAERNLPAIFFVNKAFAQHKEIFFKHKASIICNELEQKEELSIKHKKLLLSNDPVMQSHIDLHWEAKKHDEQELANQLYLNVLELKEIKAMGHLIGGHSVNHPHYSFISLEEGLQQTLESCRWVKETFQPELLTFAFPFEDFFLSKSFYSKLAKDVNAPVLTFGTSNGKVDVIPTNIQRIDAEKDGMPMAQRIPKHKRNCLARKLLNRNTVKRKDAP